MSIPDFQSIMLPLLKFAGDKQEHSLRETIDALVEEFKLTDEERSQLLPSGQRAVFDDRVSWARTYLKKAGILKTTRRGYYRITERGQDILRQNPSEINVDFLRQFPEFLEFLEATRIKSKKTENEGIDETQTPEEIIEAAYQNLRQGLAVELLQRIKGCSPAFFERLVIDLLVRMGYGGTRKDASKRIGKSRDGGIDGIIQEDRLGLDVVYIQAKRWDGVVGRPEVQKFAGALQARRARKGVFITTSAFSQDAQDYVEQIDSKIVLIDGNKLADFMISHNVGVAPVALYELKRIDSDYFTEE